MTIIMIIPAPPIGLCTMKLRDDLANFVISGGVVRACDVMSRESTFLLPIHSLLVSDPWVKPTVGEIN